MGLQFVNDKPREGMYAKDGITRSRWLLMHGMDDKVTDVKASEVFADKVRESGGEVEFIKIKGGYHERTSSPHARRTKALKA